MSFKFSLTWLLEKLFAFLGIPLSIVKPLVMFLVALTILFFILITVIILFYLFRKILGFIQTRLGPMRVGFFQVIFGPIRVGVYGILQPIADALKLFLKEDNIPHQADKWVFNLAPLVVFVPSYLIYVVIPFDKKLIVKDLNIGVVYIAAVTAITVIGIVMAGWGSNNKYSLLGAMRSAAQIISYEVPIVLSIIGVVMIASSLKMAAIVEAQTKFTWFVFLQPLGFLIFLIAGLAELNQIPFDIPEAESELVAGYHVEYSGMKFAFFFLAEFANLFALAAIATTLFLGGWHGPRPIPPIIWFFIKTYALVFLFMWIRSTLPRVRVDQLMEFSWKVLLPLAFLNIGATGLVMILLRTR